MWLQGPRYLYLNELRGLCQAVQYAAEPHFVRQPIDEPPDREVSRDKEAFLIPADGMNGLYFFHRLSAAKDLRIAAGFGYSDLVAAKLTTNFSPTCAMYNTSFQYHSPKYL